MIKVDDAVRRAIASGEGIEVAWLIELEGLRLTTSSRNVRLGRTHYISNGMVIKVPNIRRERDLRATTHTFEFLVENEEAFHFFIFKDPQSQQSRNLVGSVITLRLGLFDTLGTNNIISFPKYFEGFVDAISFSENTKITLKVKPPLSQPNLKTGRLMTDRSQQQISAGDRFFRFAHLAFDNLPWGGER